MISMRRLGNLAYAAVRGRQHIRHGILRQSFATRAAAASQDGSIPGAPVSAAAPARPPPRAHSTAKATDSMRLSTGKRAHLHGTATLRHFFPDAASALLSAKQGSQAVTVHRRLADGGLKGYHVLLSHKLPAATSASGSSRLLLSGLTYLLADTGLQPGGYVRLAWGPEVEVAEGGRQQRLVLVEMAPELELEKEQEEEKEELVSQPAQVGPAASPAAAATAQAPAAAVPQPPAAPAYDPLFTDTLRLSTGRRNRLNGRVTLRTFFPEATQAVIAAQGGSETVQLHCRLEGTGGLKRYDVLLSYVSSKSGNNVVLSGLKRFMAETGLQPGGYVRLAWGPEVADMEGGQQRRLVLAEVVQS